MVILISYVSLPEGSWIPQQFDNQKWIEVDGFPYQLTEKTARRRDPSAILS